jgi:chemotaxis protein MotB
MAEAQSNERPIIIKKVKKGGHGGHHGGSWKVAYADFVTAMMAFFLLLWLLNATTEEQKKGIAEYFAPTIASRTSSGSGGILGGQTIETEGAMVANKQSPSITVTIEDPGQSESEEGEDPEALQSAAEEFDAENPQDTADFTEAAARQRIAEEEEQQFRDAEYQIRQAIQDIPDIQQLAQNLIIEQTPEGLRIQIVDQDKLSMFPRGSSTMVDQAHQLMDLVAKVIERMPNQVSITGHTDSTPFSNNTSYTNWELSTDRANASRRALLAAGVPEERIATVIGKADQEPLIAEDPASAQNRRISIVLLRESLQLAGAAAPAGVSPDGAALEGTAPAETAPQ